MARRELLVGLIPFLSCLIATIVAGHDYFHSGHHRRLATAAAAAANANATTMYPPLSSPSHHSHLVASLLLVAPVLHYCIVFVHVVVLFPVDGSHKQFGTCPTILFILFSLLCCDLPSFPLLFSSMPCHAMPCHAMPLYSILFFTVIPMNVNFSIHRYFEWTMRNDERVAESLEMEGGGGGGGQETLIHHVGPSERNPQVR